MTISFKSQIYFDFASFDENLPPSYLLKLMKNLVNYKLENENYGAFFLANTEAAQSINRIDHFTILHQPIEVAIKKNIKKRIQEVIIFGDPEKSREYRRLIPKASIKIITPLNCHLPRLDFEVERVQYYPLEYILLIPELAWWQLFFYNDFRPYNVFDLKNKWWTTTDEFFADPAKADKCVTKYLVDHIKREYWGEFFRVRKKKTT